MSDLNERDKLTDALRGLTPSSGNLRHDRVVFEAGRAKGLREARFWLGLVASLAFVCVGLSYSLVVSGPVHPEPRPVASSTLKPLPVRIETPPAPVPPPVASPAPAPAVVDAIAAADARKAWQARVEILRDGADAFPESPPTVKADASAEIDDDFLPSLPRGTIYLFPR